MSVFVRFFKIKKPWTPSFCHFLMTLWTINEARFLKNRRSKQLYQFLLRFQILKIKGKNWFLTIRNSSSKKTTTSPVTDVHSSATRSSTRKQTDQSNKVSATAASWILQCGRAPERLAVSLRGDRESTNCANKDVPPIMKVLLFRSFQIVHQINRTTLDTSQELTRHQLGGLQVCNHRSTRTGAEWINNQGWNAPAPSTTLGRRLNQSLDQDVVHHFRYLITECTHWSSALFTSVSQKKSTSQSKKSCFSLLGNLHASRSPIVC